MKHNVLWLQISVSNAKLVHNLDSVQELAHDLFEVALRLVLRVETRAATGRAGRVLARLLRVVTTALVRRAVAALIVVAAARVAVEVDACVVVVSVVKDQIGQRLTLTDFEHQVHRVGILVDIVQSDAVLAKVTTGAQRGLCRRMILLLNLLGLLDAHETEDFVR